MIEFTIETDIARPTPEVFAYVTDPEKLPSWQPGTVSAVQEGKGPLGVGARLREVHRAPGGVEMEVLLEVSEFEPDRTFALQLIDGPLPFSVEAAIRLEPNEDETRLLLTVRGQPRGPMRFMGPVLRKGLEHRLRGQCATLKELLEDGAS